jgi:hypothetical protein
MNLRVDQFAFILVMQWLVVFPVQLLHVFSTKWLVMTTPICMALVSRRPITAARRRTERLWMKLQPPSPGIQQQFMTATEQEQLQQCTAASSRKVFGSLQYQKAWITWSTLVVEHIRHDFHQTIPHPVDSNATALLEDELNRVGDVGTISPRSFADPGSRSGYALHFFGRVRRLADTILYIRNTNVPVVRAIQDMLVATTTTTTTTSTPECHLISIGGGPGYDFVGLCLAKAFLSLYDTKTAAADPSLPCGPSSFLRGTVFDYEVGWNDWVDCMDKSTDRVLRQIHDYNIHKGASSSFSCAFGGGCDITKTIDDTVNAKLTNAIHSANIFVCQYCIAENAVRLKDSNYVFFRQLFQQANDGAIFVFTETTHRLWPDLVDQLPEGMGFDVAFVKNRSFQLLIHKRIGAPTTISPLVKSQCAKMRHEGAMHTVKRERGFVRQTKTKSSSGE